MKPPSFFFCLLACIALGACRTAAPMPVAVTASAVGSVGQVQVAMGRASVSSGRIQDHMDAVGTLSRRIEQEADAVLKALAP